MTWYLNKALSNFRDTVNEKFPNRDKGSDGTIGDEAHQNTNSDHNKDADGSVDAWDMDVELNGKGKPFEKDLARVIAAAIKHESIQYIIYNRKITSRNKPGGLGEWHDYYGANPHDKHVHFNTRSSHERSAKPWNIEGVNMAILDADARKVAGAVWSATYGPDVMGTKLHRVDTGVSDIKSEVRALKDQVAALANTPPGSVVISDEQLKRVLRELLGELDNNA